MGCRRGWQTLRGLDPRWGVRRDCPAQAVREGWSAKTRSREREGREAEREAVEVAEREEEAEPEAEAFRVDPWTVEGRVDYDRLCAQFGCDKVTPAMLRRFERLTGQKPHPMIRRLLYYAHRDFDAILDCYEKGEPFYLYTGRGPSSASMHLGHVVPFLVNKHLQEAFGVPLVIQITDDEKFFWKDLSLAEATRLGCENAKDIIAMGFDVAKTFMFLDCGDEQHPGYMATMYRNVCRVQARTQYNTVKALFGFEDHGTVVGKIAYPPIQAVPAFASTFPVVLGGRRLRCLIPCAIDQDPYFRMTRDVAPHLGEFKCSTLYSKFLPGLHGPMGKMSSTAGQGVDTNAIFLDDDAAAIAHKIHKHAFSGGRATLAEHRRLGADLAVDVAFQYLTFFLDDDDELRTIAAEYGGGRMSTKAVKQRLVEVLVPIVEQFQARRAKVTEDDLQAFLRVRPLQF